MKKCLIAFIMLLFLSYFSWAGQLVPIYEPIDAGGEVEQELGYTSWATAETNTTTDRCSRHTTDGVMTVSYGYFYTQDFETNDSETIVMAVFGSDGGSPSKPNYADQIGGCSDSNTITNDAFHWEELTWSSDYPALSAATEYFVCSFVSGVVGTGYVTGSANDEWFEGETACPGADAIDETGSTRNTAQTVANYNVR